MERCDEDYENDAMLPGFAEGYDNARIRDHRDMIVRQSGMDFAVNVYKATSTFPREEKYGLTSQLRRAALSITANIAEGYGRESHSLIELSARLDLLPEQSRTSLESEAIRILKMLRALIRALETKTAPQ